MTRSDVVLRLRTIAQMAFAARSARQHRRVIDEIDALITELENEEEKETKR